MTTTHLKNLLSGSTSTDKPVAARAPTHQATPAVTDKNNTAQEEDDITVATQEGKASDHMLTTGSRKRSILLNMMLPPEAPAVDAKLALPPVILFPPVLEPEGSITIQDRSMDVSAAASETLHTSASNSTSWSLRSWAWRGKDGAGGGQISKRSKGHTQGEEHKGKQGHAKHSGGGAKKDGIVKTVNVVESKTTTTVSKTTQVRTWISRIGGSRSDESSSKQATVVPCSSVATGSGSKTALETTTIPGGMVQQQQQQEQEQQQLTASQSQSTSEVQVDQQGNVMAVQQRQEIIHQEIHQKTRSVALVSVNVSVSDVFGLGKVMEVILALFHAHGAFLRRSPFWLQCVLMAWEGVVVLMLVWGVLRVVGLAEVIVWGADDLIRGTLSTVQLVGRTLQSYLTPY